jgi:hypothetical protein
MMTIHKDYYMQFRTVEERDRDEAYEQHLDGECPGPSQNDKDTQYCQFCEENRHRQQYEDRVKKYMAAFDRAIELLEEKK